MSVGSRGLDLSNHINAPHCKGPRSSQDVERNQRDMNFVSIDLTLVASTGMLMAVSFHAYTKEKGVAHVNVRAVVR